MGNHEGHLAGKPDDSRANCAAFAGGHGLERSDGPNLYQPANEEKALGYQKSGRSYLYYPLISEKECVCAESRSFLNRVFNGAAGLMMTNFLEETHLSDQEIERLQQILLEKQGKESKDSKD